MTRSVADRRESRPQPKVIGPRRNEPRAFVPPANKATSINLANSSDDVIRQPSPAKVGAPPIGLVMPAAIVARPPVFTATGLIGTSSPSIEATVPPTVQSEAQPRGTIGVPSEFIPPPAPPSAPHAMSNQVPAAHMGSAIPKVIDPANAHPIAVRASPNSTAAFAEFERTFPISRKEFSRTEIVSEVAWPDEDIEAVVPSVRLPASHSVLPLIIPAGRTTPIIEPAESSPKSTASAKELPDVSDSPANLDSTARPRDVAVLVEQVFEDLRQRRMDDARQRTSWLKQFVSQRGPSGRSSSAVHDAVEASDVVEPKHLNVDPQATAVQNTTP